ncbi:hypothetical protein NA63_0131 [Flavobacteriaceae bacterium MAR_2010_105]|nr:hypothetical protein NA63_0131 [Flavobacteriaceae bacterium MAR_2010_105]
MKPFILNRLLFYFLIGTLIFNCSLDEEPNQGGSTNSAVVSFTQQNFSVLADVETITIPLKLDPKAFNNGFVTIELSGEATYGTDYTTVPAASNGKIVIEQLANTQITNLTISKVNTNFNSEKTLNLKLKDPTTGFSIGTLNTAIVTFKMADQITNTLNFNGVASSISEGSNEGLTIELKATSSLTNGGSAHVKLQYPEGKVYGTNFYTVPAAIMNEIALNFNQNSQSTSFKIIPMDDNWALDDYNVVFEIITAGNMVIGENKVYTATILDNDHTTETINTIAQLRSKFNQHQGDWYMATDYFIEGVITSNGNTLDNKTVYIQDATGGILIRFMMPNIFSLGDKIRLNLVNGSGITINNQKGIDQVSISGYAKYAENVIVQAEVITIPQLLSGDFEGKRVKIENVHFVNADNVRTFLGSHTIKRDNDVAVVATHESATFSNTVLPQGTLSVTGIVGDWGHVMPQKYSHDITN